MCIAVPLNHGLSTASSEIITSLVDALSATIAPSLLSISHFLRQLSSAFARFALECLPNRLTNQKIIRLCSIINRDAIVRKILLVEVKNKVCQKFFLILYDITSFSLPSNSK